MAAQWTDCSDSEQSIPYSLSDSNSTDRSFLEHIPNDIYVHGYSPDALPSSNKNSHKVIDFKAIFAAANEANSKCRPRTISHDSDEENKSTCCSSLSITCSGLISNSGNLSSGLLDDTVREAVEAIQTMKRKENAAPSQPDDGECSQSLYTTRKAGARKQQTKRAVSAEGSSMQFQKRTRGGKLHKDSVEEEAEQNTDDEEDNLELQTESQRAKSWTSCMTSSQYAVDDNMLDQLADNLQNMQLYSNNIEKYNLKDANLSNEIKQQQRPYSPPMLMVPTLF